MKGKEFKPKVVKIALPGEENKQQDPEPAAPEDEEEFKIYFEDKKSLLEHLSHLEEDNLFKIHLV